MIQTILDGRSVLNDRNSFLIELGSIVANLVQINDAGFEKKDLFFENTQLQHDIRRLFSYLLSLYSDPGIVFEGVEVEEANKILGDLLEFRTRCITIARLGRRGVDEANLVLKREQAAFAVVYLSRLGKFADLLGNVAGLIDISNADIEGKVTVDVNSLNGLLSKLADYAENEDGLMLRDVLSHLQFSILDTLES